MNLFLKIFRTSMMYTSHMAQQLFQRFGLTTNLSPPSFNHFQTTPLLLLSAPKLSVFKLQSNFCLQLFKPSCTYLSWRAPYLRKNGSQWTVHTAPLLHSHSFGFTYLHLLLQELLWSESPTTRALVSGTIQQFSMPWRGSFLFPLFDLPLFILTLMFPNSFTLSSFSTLRSWLLTTFPLKWVITLSSFTRPMVLIHLLNLFLRFSL